MQGALDLRAFHDAAAVGAALALAAAAERFTLEGSTRPYTSRGAVR
jgi:hypothetical protein